ncbi:MAG: OmpA family protein [Barnesiella sp.]
MNGTTGTGKYMNSRLFVLWLLVCSLLPNVQAQNIRTGKPVQTADSVRTVYSGIIYFSLNNGDWIERSEYKKAGRLLRWALSDTITPITIIGWTDPTGTETFNEQLSLRRARTVRNYLVGKGVSAGRIRIKGCGVDTRAANNDEARRAEIARVTFSAGILPAEKHRRLKKLFRLLWKKRPDRLERNKK